MFLLLRSRAICGLVSLSATLATVAWVQVPVAERVRTTSDGSDPPVRLVLTTAWIRPLSSAARLLRLMWSSARPVPARGVRMVQSDVGAEVELCMAKRKAVDAWSDHMIPTEDPVAITAEMSSEDTEVSLAGTRVGL